MVRSFCVLAAAILGVSSVLAAAPAAPDSFARHPDVEGVSVSPRGDRIAVLMRVKDRVVLNVLRIADMKSIGTFGLHGDRDIEDIYWASNDRILFGMSYREGRDEAVVSTGDLMAVNVDGSAVTTLLGPDKDNLIVLDLNYRDWTLVDRLDQDPDSVLVAKYEGVSESPYLYRLNVKSGARTRLMQSRYRYGDFMTDHDGKVRFQGGTERDGTYVVLYRESEDADWREVARYTYKGSDSGGDFEPVAFSSDNRKIYYLSAGEESTAGLYLLDPDASTGPQLLHRDATYDMAGLIPGRRPGEPIGVRWSGERDEWRYFEPHHPDVTLIDSIRKVFAGKDLRFVSRSVDGSKVVVFVDSDVEPGSYFLLDLDKAAVLGRFPTRPWIDPKTMQSMQPVALQARDGTPLHGYLTQPAAQQREQKKMVVLVHGGPIGIRDLWGFDPEVQWLAANGYAVLQVNFRGSGGHGPAFEAAGYGEFGGRMQDDVTDATRWAIAQGYADESAICIYGASYGGYSAMMGLVREPSLYRCGVGYAGIYDLERWQRSGLASSTSEGRAYQRAVIGKDKEQLRRISPAARAAEIGVPVLLVHGGEDQRAPVDQYKAMLTALESQSRHVETIYKKNEGHGFYSEANVAEFYRKLIDFLDEHTD